MTATINPTDLGVHTPITFEQAGVGLNPTASPSQEFSLYFDAESDLAAVEQFGYSIIRSVNEIRSGESFSADLQFVGRIGYPDASASDSPEGPQELQLLNRYNLLKAQLVDQLSEAIREHVQDEETLAKLQEVLDNFQQE